MNVCVLCFVLPPANGSIRLGKLIAYLEKKNPPVVLPIQIAYYAGLRIGEVCGLTWQDINLEEQYLTVKRSMCQVIVGTFSFSFDV